MCAKGINKRSRNLQGDESIESNAQEVSRKFEAGLQETDLKVEFVGEVWKTTILTSASETFAADIDGNMVFGDQSIPGSGEVFEDGSTLDRLPCIIPFNCKIDEVLLVTTSVQISTIGNAHSASHYQTFKLSVNRGGIDLSQVGYQTSPFGFKTNETMQITGLYDLQLAAGDVINMTYDKTGSPYPTSSGSWHYYLRVERT